MKLSNATAKKLVEISKKYEIKPSVARAIAELGAKEGYYTLAVEIEQTLGVAMGYPYYASDQKNFPGATEKDGVCVGAHVPESLADEAARHLIRMGKAIAKVLNEPAALEPFVHSALANGLGDFNGPSRI